MFAEIKNARVAKVNTTKSIVSKIENEEQALGILRSKSSMTVAEYLSKTEINASQDAIDRLEKRLGYPTVELEKGFYLELAGKDGATLRHHDKNMGLYFNSIALLTDVVECFYSQKAKELSKGSKTKK